MDKSFYSRWFVGEECNSRLHKKWAWFPHWCLLIIGVSPCYQGQGYASMLLRAKLDEVDRQNMTCYCETHSEKNVGLYKHFGFEVVEETFIPKSNVPVWSLLRKKCI